jgi:Mrp family chromosome partitioning ATPase
VQSLAQEGLREPFSHLKEEFDFVLIDSGPVLTDADALLFGHYVDGVILSILRDVSQVPRVFEACERLRSVNIRLLGAVVNGVNWGRYRSYYRPYSVRVDETAAPA